MAKQYKKPDLNAPRYRPKKLNLTNIDFYNRFIQENPKRANELNKLLQTVLANESIVFA